ncbi:MAG: glycolate oxidase iron-sulfur subunit [Gammaproteobacteria bacterium]|nr:glycolate oxidase iron-sulfur subunit [Gammaproteobacteria bacterium]OUU08121.1 MAG: glycolate oxidase iron-sulfur subunit [Gammaproteobacteria bacterium TMED34]
MQTHIHPQLAGRSDVKEAEDILRACVHCGFCTAVCPTYQLLGDELDGPRGRIYLIKNLLETDTIGESAAGHLDRCLTCRACETTCPSGVEYGRLLDVGRGLAARKVAPPLMQRLKSWLLRNVVPRHWLFKFMYRTGRLLRPVMPGFLQSLIPTAENPHFESTSINQPQQRALLLGGCTQDVVTPGVNSALESILTHGGVEPVTLAGEGCCGALQYHMSDHAGGLARMRQLLDRLDPILNDVDVVISSASGCGVTLKDYPHLLEDDEVYSHKAKRLAEKLLDATEFIDTMTPLPCETATVAVHTPCTLQHGQRLSGLIERVLTRWGMTVVPVRDAHVCCGSAGSYSIMQPALSSQLRENKVSALQASGADHYVTANVGCQMHLDDLERRQSIDHRAAGGSALVVEEHKANQDRRQPMKAEPGPTHIRHWLEFLAGQLS